MRFLIEFLPVFMVLRCFRWLGWGMVVHLGLDLYRPRNLFQASKWGTRSLWIPPSELKEIVTLKTYSKWPGLFAGDAFLSPLTKSYKRQVWKWLKNLCREQAQREAGQLMKDNVSNMVLKVCFKHIVQMSTHGPFSHPTIEWNFDVANC